MSLCWPIVAIVGPPVGRLSLELKRANKNLPRREVLSPSAAAVLRGFCGVSWVCIGCHGISEPALTFVSLH